MKKKETQTIRDLPRKDLFVLVFSLMLPSIVVSASVYQVFLSHVEYSAEFKVFDTTIQDWGNGNKTQVLTYGDGKYLFIGSWYEFQPEHTYNVTYVRQYGGSHSYSDLIILSISEIV